MLPKAPSIILHYNFFAGLSKSFYKNVLSVLRGRVARWEHHFTLPATMVVAILFSTLQRMELVCMNLSKHHRVLWCIDATIVAFSSPSDAQNQTDSANSSNGQRRRYLILATIIHSCIEFHVIGQIRSGRVKIPQIHWIWFGCRLFRAVPTIGARWQFLPPPPPPSPASELAYPHCLMPTFLCILHFFWCSTAR